MNHKETWEPAWLPRQLGQRDQVCVMLVCISLDRDKQGVICANFAAWKPGDVTFVTQILASTRSLESCGALWISREVN
jgi:hypothetical protein